MSAALKPKYETCIHSTGKSGEIAVYVMPSCPRQHMLKGNLVTSKRECLECRSYKERKK